MPYRSSSFLTQFFQEIGLPYSHDGSTRKWWVASVLEELNTGHEEDQLIPTDLEKVVLHLVDPLNYIDRSASAVKYDHERAVQELNKVLALQGLMVKLEPRTFAPYLQSAKETFVSSSKSRVETKQVITFSPDVFKHPKRAPQSDLVGVMMPFAKEYDDTFRAIKAAVANAGLVCERADDAWNDSVIVQDIFELIFASKIIVTDFTSRNPNVMYETGIAHCLGKHVIPITQSTEDIPFDLRHHRFLKYLPNGEGLLSLVTGLESRLRQLS